MTEQTLQFEAEVSRLLDIVANALYSNQEIFLRELISNASDACDRLRYEALTKPELVAGDSDFHVTLAVDKKAGTLIVSDNGIGMSRDDLIANLGTIARSGTAAFVEGLTPDSGEDKPKAKGKAKKADKPDVTQIGQFGVGFYSAFMVADQVEVASRRAGESEGWLWRSDGKGSFTIDETEEAPARGTRIALHLKKDAKDFLEIATLRRIVRTYSDHIAIPIRLADSGAKTDPDQPAEEETLNQASALWTRPKSEISEEQYKEFYHHVGHGFDEPWLRLHFKAEGMLEYAGLLYVPSAKPFDLFHPDRKHRVKLYVKRVFITDECSDLVPSYLRFLTGVIDTEDLPLNISRELLQDNPLIRRIRTAVTKRVITELGKKAEKVPEEYRTFWSNFGSVLKEGLYEDPDQRDKLLPLCRFHSTAGDGTTSLADYLGRMKEGQEAIYTIAGDDLAALRRSPQLEGFVAKGIEVLLLTDPVDEFWIPAVGDHEGKPFKSVTRGGADLDKFGKDEKASDEKEQKEEGNPNLDALLAFVRLTLKDEVKDVRASARLTESAVCLVADEGDLDIHLERMLKQHRQIDERAKRILEVNPTHPLIARLGERIGKDGAGAELEEVAHLLLDQARILEGEPLPDPSAYVRRVAGLVEKGLGG